MIVVTERTSRITGEHDAAALIDDGMTVAFGEPMPMMMVRALIRRGVKDLTVIAAGVGLDHLIAAGCVRKTMTYYAGGGFGVPVAPSFRGGVERGELEVWECEEGILTSGLEAAGKGLPFLPWRGGVGTSLPELNPDLKLIEDPINGEPVLAVPAIKPDVAVLHAYAADAHGNVQHFGGPGWLDLFLDRAADKTIVQVERVIANEDVRANPWATTIGGADVIVRGTYGAHPFYSRGAYVQDVPFVQSYLEAANKAYRGDQDQLETYLKAYCREPQSNAEYLERVGMQRLLDLYEY